MAPQKPNQQKDSKSLLLILLLIAGAGTFYFLGSSEKMGRKISRPNQVSAYSPEAEALVNKHLLLTSRNLELNEKRTQAENQFSAPQLGDTILENLEKNKKDYGVDHSADTNESNAYEDLNRYRQDLRVTDPNAIITNQIHDQDVAQEYDQAYRVEYARQFVENARRNGYEIKLDQNYVVISVRKIRQPSSVTEEPVKKGANPQ